MPNQITDLLNKQIANWSILYVKLHNYHWYVKGEQFFTLHIKFEEFYNEAGLHVDALAERVLTIGGKPVATMKEFLEISSVKDAENNESAQQMVQTIIDDFTTVVKELYEGIEISEQLNDGPTVDLLLGIKSGLEKHVWMLKAFAGNN